MVKHHKVAVRPREGVGINPLKKLLEKRDNASSELEGILRDAETGEDRETLTDEQESRATELLDEIKAFDVEIEKVSAEVRTQKMLAEARKAAGTAVSTDVQVVDEPMVYGGGSENSYYLDKIAIAQNDSTDVRHQRARERQLRWSDQVEREVADRSEFGKVAERQLREIYRKSPEREVVAIMAEIRERGRTAREIKDGTELRAVGTGGGTTASSAGGGAAAFVTPVFGHPYVPYREYGRAFADACFKGDLPDTGMAIYKPYVSGPASVAQFTELNPGTEVDPAAGLLTAALVIFEGHVTLSQAVIDRTSPDYRFDVMCEDQLHRNYDPKFDAYVLARALAGATPQPWTGKTGSFELVASTLPGSGGFSGQVSLAKANMRKLEGTVLNATHLFLDPSRWEFIAAWADAQGRPVVVPDYNGPFNALGNSGDGDAGIEGYTGARFAGLPVYTDANIPTTGGTLNQDQALVGALQEVEVYEGNAINRVLPQTLATNLETILQRYSYGTVLVNYPGAVTTINGTGMSAITSASYVG